MYSVLLSFTIQHTEGKEQEGEVPSWKSQSEKHYLGLGNLWPNTGPGMAQRAGLTYQVSSDRGLSKVSEKASEKRRGTRALGFREHARTVPQEGLGSGSAGGENGVSHGERQKWG